MDSAELTHRRETVTSAPKWTAILAVVTFLALLSAAQIYLRQRAAGESPSWLEAVATNLLAWLPWAVIAPAVFWLGRRVPLAAKRWWANAAVHLGAAVVVAIGFLTYLTVFWFAVFPEIMGTTTFLRAFGDALGEFFLVAFMGYWLIVAVGFGIEVFGRYREVASARADAAARPEPEAPRRLEVRSRGRVRYVDVDDIDWIEASGSYVRLHTDEREWLLRRTLAGLSDELGERFVRIHRSAVVNSERVVELRPLSHGEAMVRLKSGQERKVSRSYRKHVESILK